MTDKKTKPSQVHRVSNSFYQDEVTALRMLCECALKQTKAPLALVRSPGFNDLYRKAVGMNTTLTKRSLGLATVDEQPGAEEVTASS